MMNASSLKFQLPFLRLAITPISHQKLQMKTVKEILETAIADAGIQNTKAPERVPKPDVAESGILGRDDQWKVISWIIDTAEKAGEGALHGLALSFGKILQGEALRNLLCDSRSLEFKMAEVNLLWDTQVKIANGKNILELISPPQTEKTVAFSEAVVFANPWVPWRLCRALENLADKEWIQDENHQATIWTPWPILWVDNGNHSVTVGSIYGKGVITVPCYDATPLLNSVKTDGGNWIRTEDESVIGPVKYIEMAAIFEIGRRLVNLHI